MPSAVVSSPTGLEESISVAVSNGTLTMDSSKVAGELDAMIDARLKRAERFGMPPGENEKAALRAARFGIELKSIDCASKKVLSNAKSLKPCFLFQATGSCDKGDACKFSHPVVVTDEERAVASAKVAEVYILIISL